MTGFGKSEMQSDDLILSLELRTILAAAGIVMLVCVALYRCALKSTKPLSAAGQGDAIETDPLLVNGPAQ